MEFYQDKALFTPYAVISIMPKVVSKEFAVSDLTFRISVASLTYLLPDIISNDDFPGTTANFVTLLTIEADVSVIVTVMAMSLAVRLANVKPNTIVVVDDGTVYTEVNVSALTLAPL